MSSPTRTVTACVSTFRRPVGLATLIESLAAATVPDPWHFRVVVVDNDADGTARNIIDSLNHLDLDVVYVVEARQGIPMARNCGTELALSLGTDELIYIDDDEWVEVSWLVELLSARSRHDCPIVMGAVIAEFEQEPPSWVRELDAFQRRIHPDGHELDFAITANVILDATILGDELRPFDETLRYGGGEDLHLFQRLNRMGHKIVFAPDARAHELVPNSRVDTAWLIKRHYRRGINRSIVLRKLNLTPRTVLKRLMGAAVEVVSGASILGLGVLKGQTTRLRGRLRISYGRGLLVGLTGHQYEEYRTIHGS